MDATIPPFRLPGRALMLLVFAASLTLYLLTMPHTVALEDDGLFILSSYFNGVSHPPGYPLHSLMGNLITQLPFGSVAARVHALSALFAALSCTLLWAFAFRITQSLLAATAAALLLALSQKFWSQAIIAEVYTLNSFFFIAVFYLLWQALAVYRQAPASRAVQSRLMAAALLFGLSLSNHWPLMVLSAPAYLILAWPVLRQQPLRVPALLPLVLIGLAPYGWMVVNSLANPVISFSGPINSVGEFIEFVSRSRYAAVDTSTSADWRDKLAFVWFFFRQLLDQFGVIGALLALAGAFALWRAGKRLLLGALLYAFAANGLLLIALLGFDHDPFREHIISVYFLPAWLVAALLAGIGLQAASDGLRGVIASAAWRTAAAVSLLVTMLAVLLLQNLAVNNRSAYQWGETYAGKVLAMLPPDSVLITGSDISLGAIGYVHLVLGQRPDIRLVYDKGLVLRERPFDPEFVQGYQVREHLQAYLQTLDRPVFATENNYRLFQDDYWLIHAPNPELGESGRIMLAAADFDYMQAIKHSADSRDYWTALHRQQLLRRAIPFLVEMKVRGFRPREVSALLSAATDNVQSYLVYADYLLQRNLLQQEAGSMASVLAHADALAAQSGLVADRARVMNYRALLAALDGDTERAMKTYRESIALWPNNDNPAFYRMGRLYQAAGRAQEFNAFLKPFGEYLYNYNRLR